MSNPPRYPRAYLKAGKDKAAAQMRHPWIFSGAVAKEPGAQSGEIAMLCDAGGTELALATYHPTSQIRLRVIDWNTKATIDQAWLVARLRRAVEWRQGILNKDTNACRLVFSESDGLPGLVVDQYADVLVLQLLTAGMDLMRDGIVAALSEIVPGSGIYERSDDASRSYEGLGMTAGWLKPRASGAAKAGEETVVDIIENGVRYGVDVAKGHKTGFYLDQRQARARVAAHANGRRVLNCFCYTGGFSLAAAAHGATSVVSVDASGEALGMAARNAERNSQSAAMHQWLEADVFEYLRVLKGKGERFDLIVLDPPKFASSQKHLNKATRGYKDINMLGMELLNPGGYLATFSCSGAISRDLFQKILFGAALDAKCDMSIVEPLAQAECHPIHLCVPQTEYLKGFLLRKM